MKTMSLDESGDHNLKQINPNYPIFVLAGVIVESDAAEDEMREGLEALKMEFFGNADFPLHTREMKRHLRAFHWLKYDAEMRNLFESRLNELMDSLNYTAVACVIDKRTYLERSAGSVRDPYLLGLGVLVEQFCAVVGQVRAGGRIIAEARRPQLDRRLMEEWKALRIAGTGNLRGATIRRRLTTLAIRPKTDLVPSLEVADFVASPIGRIATAKPVGKEWDVVRRKLRKGPDGAIEGFGIIRIP